MNNIYLGDAYAQIDQIHDKWLADDDGTFLCYSLEKPRANGIETIELMLEAYAAESLKRLNEVRNDHEAV